MGFGSKGSNTTTQTTGPSAAAMGAYTNVLDRAAGVASTPYTPYTGELVAGVNQQQNLGINNINQNAGFAQPYIQQAATYANNAAQPLTAQQIQQYQSPYTQQVVNATQGAFNTANQQALSNIKGNEIAQGALGGSRNADAAAQYYGAVLPQQNAQIAGLYNQGYSTALQTAEQQQQNQANAAYSLGNLGVAGQNAALTGANAQLGAGGLQQSTQQALDAAQLQQFQTAQAFPYQQTQWLAGIDTGVGSQMGGTSSTTAPAPNPLNSILGLGLAGAGVAGNLGWKPFGSKRGGGIPGFAPGGAAESAMPYAGVGWIPTLQIAPGKGAPDAPKPPQQTDPMDTLQKGLGGLSSLKGGSAGSGISTDPIGSGFPLEGSADANSLNYVVPMTAEGFASGPHANGGGIEGFADGGAPTFDDFWAARGLPPVPTATADRLPSPTVNYSGGDIDARDINLNSGSGGLGLGAHYDPTNAAIEADAGGHPYAASAPIAGLGAPASAPLAYGAGYDRSPAPATAATPAGGGGTSPVWTGLMAAGLGMMASRSPFLGQAIGEGGLQGLGAYNQQVQEQFAREQKQQATALDTRKVELEAQKLSDEANRWTKQLQIESATPKTVGTDMFGRPIHGVLDEKTGTWVDPLTRQPIDASKIQTGREQAMGSTAKMIANYALPPISPMRMATPEGQMLMNAVQSENPDYNATFYNEANKARSAFGTGPQGNAVRSFGVGISHLDVLDQAADALNSGDVRKLNALKQYFQTELGLSTAPTSFDAIKPIVAAEVTKAIVGSNMTQSDREEIQAGLRRDLATMNIKDVIDKYKQLMGGQLVGLERQYRTSTHGAKDFEEKLSPAAVDMLRKAQTVERPAASPAQPPPSRTPTDADRAYAKAHPEVHDKFVSTFGVEP